MVIFDNAFCFMKKSKTIYIPGTEYQEYEEILDALYGRFCIKCVGKKLFLESTKESHQLSFKFNLEIEEIYLSVIQVLNEYHVCPREFIKLKIQDEEYYAGISYCYKGKYFNLDKNIFIEILKEVRSFVFPAFY